jgi:GntR family transcriptional regulator, transcriptional repressor for pyruvate dehydrogenase complex
MTNSPVFARVQRVSAYEQVAEQIREVILQGSLSPEQELPPERTLAVQFGVSRTTIREALRHLQAQGLLAPRGRTSPMRPADSEVALTRFREALRLVVQLRDVPLSELIQLRLAIESAALTQAALAPVASYLQQARDALEAMSAARISQHDFYEADARFHVALVAASGNQAMRLVMLAVKDSIELYLDEAMRGRSFAKIRAQITEEHRQLLSAVENGHGNAAGKLLRAHLEFYGT